jgi:Ca2+-binding EF-hand superfamily protein
MNKTMIASIAALLATSSIAFAHGGKGHARFDRDGNGIVTRDEMRTTEIERFEKMDANRDGQLTLDEVQAFGKERAAKRFAAKDKNGDGQLSRAEVQKMPDPMFARLDTNGDGLLSKEELEKKAEHFQEHAAKRFQRSDADHNGAISQGEALAQVDKRFARMDKNGDGLLTQDELKAHHGHGKPEQNETKAR